MSIIEIKDEEMIPTLIAQHDELCAEIKDMHMQALDISVHADKLYADMQALRTSIEIHVALENGVFYPKLLKKLEEKRFDIEKTKEFIAQMAVIGAKVFAFLEKYNSAEAIKANKEQYCVGLEEMSSALLIWMSTEEDSVYLYWGM